MKCLYLKYVYRRCEINIELLFRVLLDSYISLLTIFKLSKIFFTIFATLLCLANFWFQKGFQHSNLWFAWNTDVNFCLCVVLNWVVSWFNLRSISHDKMLLSYYQANHLIERLSLVSSIILFLFKMQDYTKRILLFSFLIYEI